ncbi:hypothetical protein ACFFNY_31205 [Paenibacillus hodogayensis]|uniref:Uncharacterized protein n=1 Tax=Paenibacillus hodogayensis TaxID=279208 RepID=A0ABV5W6Q4_9BACL
MTNPNLNVTRPYEEFNQAFVRLGFLPAEREGRKVIQLTFFSPDRSDKIVYRIPFISDDSERITLLVQEAEFGGGWGGSNIIPEGIQEEAHYKLCILVGQTVEEAAGELFQEADACYAAFSDRWEEEDGQSAVNGVMAPEEQDLIRLGKEMKAMKTNSELEQEGLIPDPIQN